ncbi:hypothetical protein [Thermococcus sp.]|uniref:hypothetical protein n=1 Tax=Thermococcus sp. TaxID=35749 RepID=UPI00260D9763|nr:hypothetical protein [Thermococcus sp.]
MGGDRYKIKYTIYKLLGEKGGLNPELLPKFPFYSTGGISKVVDGQKTFTSQDDLIKLLLPSKPSNGCFLNNTHTFPNKFYGFPRVLYCGHNSTIGEYTRFQNGGILLLQVLTSNITSIRPLLSLTNAPVNETDGVMMGLFLGGGNTVPPQDWAGWLRYGFGTSFPLNVGFVILGMLLLIIASRRT